jgi:serine/threonine protein kinase
VRRQLINFPPILHSFARFIEPGDLATTLVGSPLYMAPEMFLEYKYTEKADLWSVGAIVYKILTKEVHGPHLRFHREYSRFC